MRSLRPSTNHTDLDRNAYFFLSGWRVLVPHWFFIWALWNVAVDMHGLIVASLLQDLHLPATPVTTMALHIFLTLLYAPVVQLAHSFIFFSVLIFPAKNFIVIKKV